MEPDLAIVTHTLSFAPPILLSINSSTRSVVLGDFNEDQKLDVVANDEGQHLILLFLGDGKGGFVVPTSFPCGSSTNWLAVGDIDGDTHLDVVSNDFVNHSFTLLSGDGKGGFAAARSITGIPGKADQIVVGDVNRDGIDDVVIVDDTAVDVFLGAKQGPITMRSTTQFPSNPRFIALADVTSDKKLDLVVGEDSGVALAIGLGDGTFTAPKSLSNQLFVVDWIAVGDLDGDSRRDLAAADEGGRIETWLGDGKGGFKVATMTPPMSNAFYADALADFDGDGKLDLAVVGSSDQLLVYPGDGKGGWNQPFSTMVAQLAPSIAVGDFDGDGKPDIAIADLGLSQVEVLLNTSM